MKTRTLAMLGIAGALVLATSALAAIVDGTPGDDRLRGTPDADVIRALAGNDRHDRVGRGRRIRLLRQRQHLFDVGAIGRARLGELLVRRLA